MSDAVKVTLAGGTEVTCSPELAKKLGGKPERKASAKKPASSKSDEK